MAGVYNAGCGTFNFKNSIIALNEKVIPRTPFPANGDDDCSGTISSQVYIILYYYDSGYCTDVGPFTPINPQLGPLQNNGGPTQTYALQPGSPAIDAGEPTNCTENLGAPSTTDQRSVPRPHDGNGDSTITCDIGAYERGKPDKATMFSPANVVSGVRTKLVLDWSDIGGALLYTVQVRKGSKSGELLISMTTSVWAYSAKGLQ